MFAVEHNDADQRVADLARFTDILRLRNGTSLTLRFPTERDADALANYFRNLSSESRYSRLLGAASELPPSELDKALHVGEGSRFSVLAEMRINGADVVVGEARYSFDAQTRASEFGISIGDNWQGQGIGAAILANLECRTAALGAVTLGGETFRNNAGMIGLAVKQGYAFLPTASDWRLVRFEKRLHAAEDIPCEGWKVAAAGPLTIGGFVAAR